MYIKLRFLLQFYLDISLSFMLMQSLERYTFYLYLSIINQRFVLHEHEQTLFSYIREKCWFKKSGD